jgi:hypothetical protein
MEIDQRPYENAFSNRPFDHDVPQGYSPQAAMNASNSYIPSSQSMGGNDTAAGSGLEGTLHARLFEFYSRHQPSIAPRARVIAKQYEGKEDILNRNLRQTYGVDLNHDEQGRSRPSHSDAINNNESPAIIKSDGSKPGTAGVGLPPQARPISLKQFLALLQRKDIIPR